MRELHRPASTGPAGNWPHWRAVRYLREGGQSLGLFPLLWLGYGVDVRGRAHAMDVAQPCLIVSNHNMHLDWSMVLRALPRHVRRRTAIAAAATDIFGSRWRAFTGQLFGNAFPFHKHGPGIRESLEDVTALLDGGWSVFLLPEGALTVGGEMQPFQSGIGWLAARSGVEVLPIRIEVLRRGVFEGRWWPMRGRVRVHIGEPLRIPADADHGAATEFIEMAVRNA